MTLFTIENREFGWDEIAIAAELWGEWRPFFEKTRQSLACLRLAEKNGQMTPAAEVRDVATAFRYAHNLISAEETQVWLDRWGMTVGDWMNCLRGQLLLDLWSHKIDRIVAAHPVSDTEVRQAIRHYAVCAGELASWTRKLAGRAAVVAKSGSLAAESQTPRDLVASIEDQFDKHSRRNVTAQSLADKIDDHRLDWIRVDCRYVWFPEERIAREAAWCLTEDGLTLEEVAYDSRTIVQQWNFYLDEIEAPARAHFLSARRGDWLGPIKMIEGFPLFSVVAKTMPVAADPQIRERAERSIVAAFTEQAINERVKWIAI